jgi:hypothetical protein
MGKCSSEYLRWIEEPWMRAGRDLLAAAPKRVKRRNWACGCREPPMLPACADKYIQLGCAWIGDNEARGAVAVLSASTCIRDAYRFQPRCGVR